MNVTGTGKAIYAFQFLLLTRFGGNVFSCQFKYIMDHLVSAYYNQDDQVYEMVI